MARYAGSGVITRKGQVTIPAEIRRSLGLKEGDRVGFVQDNGYVKIEPLGSVVERTAGVFAKYRRPGPPPTIAELKEAAAEGWTARERRYIADGRQYLDHDEHQDQDLGQDR